jgi:diacylglycerol O-acyltransferase
VSPTSDSAPTKKAAAPRKKTTAGKKTAPARKTAAKKATPRPIPASDQTWLHMDRPNNLMYVRSLMWFDEAPDLDKVRALLQERLIDRHPVFRRRAVEREGQWFWEDADDFSLDDHIRTSELNGDEVDLRAWIGDQFAEPLDHDHPLWSIEFVSGVEGYGTVMFCRFHHALADGIRLVQLMFSLCDPADGGHVLPVPVGREHGGKSLVSTGTTVMRRSAVDFGDFAVGVVRVPLRLAAINRRLAREGWGLVRQPRRVFDVFQGITSTDNQSVNTIAEVGRMLAAPRSAETAWSGTPGVEKRVAWVQGLDLDQVKKVGKDHNGTVNDVLLALVSLALTRYLEEKRSLVDEIAWLVPVSLLPFDANLPEELGNHFSLVFLPMPLGLDQTRDVIKAMHQRMLRIKHSIEPAITFGVQLLIAESPRMLAFRLTNLFANKGVGVLTNVPGPRELMTFAGAPVAGTLGWVPMSGDQPLGVCIFSYNGEVNIGIAGDASLVPDPDRIAALIEEEFTRISS